MIRNPKTWRVESGHTLAVVAARAGIGGQNPSRTYSRYENGERDCPASVIETVRRMSGGAIGAEEWQRVRLTWLSKQRRAA